MFLSELSKDNKKLFLQLSTHVVALSNDNLSKCQEDIIRAQSEELEIYDYKIQKNKDVNTLLEEIKSNSSKQEIEITLFEIITLVMCNDKFDLLQGEFINKLQETLDISKEKLTCMIYLINQLMGDYKSCVVV
ncbi:MAG: hypothetical protein ACRC3Y_11380 [Romboutsia sp.]|uniref:hypothetical protein n=1 Tax=Romboutsia sp. TaxID=1965302 RepID=UPI003F401E08